MMDNKDQSKKNTAGAPEGLAGTQAQMAIAQAKLSHIEAKFYKTFPNSNPNNVSFFLEQRKFWFDRARQFKNNRAALQKGA